MSHPRDRRLWLGLAILLLTALPLGPAEAQYFGRNKVQYESFQFKRLSTTHFDIYYYEDERAMAVQAGRMAERWYQRLSRALDMELEGRQPLILYASHPDFEQTNAISGELDESTGGVTESFKRRIVLPLAGSLAETDHVIGHELVHAFQFDLRRRSTSNPLDPGAQLPLWFIEGMAEYLSVGPDDPNTSMWIRDAALSGKLPTISKLDNPRIFPYRFGQGLWAFIGSRFGEAAVGRVMKAATARGVTMEQAFNASLGWNTDSLSLEWHRSVKPWAERARADRDSSGDGVAVIVPHGDVSRLNVGPSLSPDGKFMTYLAEHEQISIEMFLAEATTGKVIRRLTRAAVDPHVQSLQFIHSAGAWSPDGKRIAISTVTRGQPALLVVDPENGRTVQRITLPRLGETFNPTWSPDGKRVAFSGLAGGSTDLFVIDLASHRVDRVTEDLYADLHPVWSPDGRSLAFSTDRFSTRLDDLHYGGLRLATLDLETRRIQEVQGTSEGKNINPQWSPDGRSLYFISDRSGISNVYVVPLSGGSARQVTDIATGVSGITALSPALSVARKTGDLTFSVFRSGGYQLRRLELGSPTASAAVRPRDTGGVDLLPDASREVLASVTAESDSGGLVDSSLFTTSRYRPGLTLDYVSQTSLGFAASGSGLAVGGGSALYWSDMLGNHNLATILQLNGNQGGVGRNLGALVGYQNLARRWNWSLQGYQVPYFYRSFEVEEVLIEPGQYLVTERDIRTWQIERGVEGAVYYPLNRARRLEFSAGYRSIAFQEEVRTVVYDPNTGQIFVDGTAPGAGDSIPALDMFMGSVAAVYDNSVFGGTSPVRGERHRIEVAPVVGDLQFASVLVDYRRYQGALRPLVVAGRVMHLGRYGPDSESNRISELFVGYPWLVRGYDSPSFMFGEADVYNRLFGSRMGVANLELRFPLVGAAGLVRTLGVPPVEVAAFYDAGAAWTDGDPARFLGGDRAPVTSVGGTFRINMFGFAVAEIAYVHPNDRPLKGWFWQFNLTPGF